MTERVSHSWGQLVRLILARSCLGFTCCVPYISLHYVCGAHSIFWTIIDPALLYFQQFLDFVYFLPHRFLLRTFS